MEEEQQGGGVVDGVLENEKFEGDEDKILISNKRKV